LLARQIRSGLAETFHHGVIAVVDRQGEVVARHGDIDQPFFLRSSAKPFQAYVSQEAGAELSPLELAMACASHRGFPVHAAMVESVLAAGGLDESALLCPPDWPLSPVAARIVQARGARPKRRVWHNCSGKHAGFLRACVARGWPIGSYLDPDHPLQRQVIATVSELGGHSVEPVGVDGCGVPVLRTTARAMATMFARLAGDEALAEVFSAMHRYPALVGSNGEGDTEIAIVSNSAAKGGAAGCLGIAVSGQFGLAVKSWDGSGLVANMAAAITLQRLGRLSSAAAASLAPIMNPPVFGGGNPVGRFEPTFDLGIA
jgi:L-asparaginase II